MIFSCRPVSAHCFVFRFAAHLYQLSHSRRAGEQPLVHFSSTADRASRGVDHHDGIRIFSDVSNSVSFFFRTDFAIFCNTAPPFGS
jgi:hypothetical protein